jgi:dihydrodipicolinate synthase/N-acetylneuraminate lyase
MDDLRGIWAAMPLPWNADGSLDRGALNELVARYAAAGAHGAYCTGTDGEFHTLELDEFRTVVTAFARAADRVGLPVHAGTGWLTLAGAIERTRIARDLGLHAVQVVPPFWVPVNDIERIRFYSALADAVPDIGILVYNTERIGKILGPAQMAALAAAVPSIVGSKYDGWDRAEFAEICAATPSLTHLPVDVGIGPSAGYPTRGLCSWVINLNPGWTMDWWRAIEAGDWGESDRRYTLAMGAMTDWESLLGPVTASSALAKICTRAGILPEMPLRVRSPYLAGTEDDVARLRSLLETKYAELLEPVGEAIRS